MTKVKSSVFLSLLFGVCLNAQDQHEPETLSALVHDMSIIGKTQQQHARSEIEEAAQKLDDDIAKKTGQIKQHTNKKTDTLKAQAEEASRKIFMNYTDQKEKLTMQAQKQEHELKQEAGQRLLALITKAEEEAFQAKHKARQEFLKEKLAVLEPKTDWKQELKQSFTQNLNYLRNIINQGESAPEAEAFFKCFDQQSAWLDTTLATTKNMTEPGYYQLVQKNAALENIVNAQKITEKILREKEKMKVAGKTVPDFAKLRLMALYEINSMMHQKSDDGVAAIAATVFTDKEAANIASSVINSDKSAKLKQKAMDMKNKLLLAEQEIAQIKKSLQEAEEKAILLDDYADRRIHEYKLYYDTKKTLLSDMTSSKIDTIAQQEHAMREDLEREIAQRILLEHKQKNTHH